MGALAVAMTQEYLNADEWQELCALKRAIDDGPCSVVPEKMERFTELFVRTLHGKGDTIPISMKQ